MAKFTVQVGAITVQIKDDRAEMDKPTLKAWKEAARELIEGAVDLLADEISEEVPEDE